VILLVDTFNVVHVTGVLPPDVAGIDTAGLLSLIERSRYRHCRAELICDGSPQRGDPQGTRGLMAVRYTGSGRQADDLIAAMIRSSNAPRHLLVVSSDKAVLREAKRRKCRTISSEEFLRQIGEDALAAGGGEAPPKPVGGLSDLEVDAWMRVFGVDAAAPSHLGNDDAPASRDKATQDRPAPSAGHGGASAASPADEESEDEPPAPLPADLIAEAERLWREGR
jgi:predicted RNA-binding protein with PIN domain